MVGASALASFCSLTPPSLPTNRDREAWKCGGGAGPHDHDLSSRIARTRRFSEATTFEAYYLDRSIHGDIIRLNKHSRISIGNDGGFSNHRVCGCGMDSVPSHSVSTSGSPGLITFARNVKAPLGTDSFLTILLHRRLSVKNLAKKLRSSELFLRGSRRVRVRDWITTVDAGIVKRGHWRHFNQSDSHIDPNVLCNSKDCSLDGDGDQQVKALEFVDWQKGRAAFAVGAVASLLSLSLSSSASAEPVRVDFPMSTIDIKALEVQLKGRVKAELESEIQVQRKEWGIKSCSTNGPPIRNLENKNIESEANEEKSNVVLEVVQSLEEKGLLAWKQVEAEIELEGEKLAVPVTRPVHKTVAKKVVAASVAVAVAGSVAGAASAAGRAVASSGGSVVTSSLTVLHSGGAFPGSSLLAKAVQHLGGGGVAGAVGATVVYPLDTIKTRMQAQSLEGVERQYKDEIDCFKQLVTNEGPGSLYNGLVPQLLGVAPEKAMKLTVNEVLLEALETMMPGARVWALEFIAGGGGGFSQVVFTNPMEIVKVKLQTQTKGAAPKNTWDVVKELGVIGLYEGAGVTMARDVPSSAIFFACYTLLRQLYPEQSFLAGCVAAIPATILVTPMDIIKTRLQKETAPGEQPCTDWLQCLQEIVQKEGPQALFKGSLLRVLRTSPQFGITLMIYGFLCDGS